MRDLDFPSAMSWNGNRNEAATPRKSPTVLRTLFVKPMNTFDN